MALLVLFAVAAGAGTALSPCVLPVLPALLSAGATGGPRPPLGVVLGLATTFTVTVAGFAKVIDGVGLGDGTLRTLAVIALLGFGAALLAPRLAERLEAPLSRLARFGPRSPRASPSASRRRSRVSPASARARAARASGRASAWARRSASSTHPAPAPSWRR